MAKQLRYARVSAGSAPWGKHSPATWRGRHAVTAPDNVSDVESTLPLVIVKDPLSWMASLCVWQRPLGTLPGLVPAPLGLAVQAAERELAVLSLAQRELAV